MPPEKPHWVDLLSEVVRSGQCTGCAACVIACPHDVLRYDGREGPYRPWKVDEDGGPDNCTHGTRGCTLCTRACPRFRDWEVEADTFLFGAPRSPGHVYGESRELLAARATNETILQAAQDGGAVSAILIAALENGTVEAALVSSAKDGPGGADGGSVPLPALATNRQEIVEAAGSRYTYSTNTLAYFDAIERGYERLAMVGTGCMASIPAVMKARKTGKSGRRFVLSVGLLCSKTFDESIYDELFEARYGATRSSIAKVNIKGRFQVWLKDGQYVEIPLKEGRDWTREGCKMCPDFAAEHADISAGGIGDLSGWTLLVVRTNEGQAAVRAAVEAGLLETRPAADDPAALSVLGKLSTASRRRWTNAAYAAPAASGS